MNASGMGTSALFKSNASFNSSFNSSVANMSFSRRTNRGENTVIISTASTQNVEPYGVPLPAMVKVALTSQTAGDQHQHSCRLDPNGWAWLVTGRKLYVWRISLEIGKKSTIACRELVLPPSELVHNAQLVSVLAVASTSAPSCIAVSPEGHITYWPNIANESSTITLNADMPGQECDSITSYWPKGCILTTTSGTVLLVKPVPVRGNKPSLTCVPLGTQKGWLGGWSKKVSTMLFTTMPAAPSGLDNKRAKVVVPLCKEDDPLQPGHNREGKVYVFQGPTVQTWQINSEANTCLNEINVDENLRKEFLDNVWSSDDDNRNDLRGIQSWVLDATVVPSTKQLAIFAAAKSQYESAENLVYGIVLFEIKNFRRRDAWQFIPVTCRLGPTILEEDSLYSWKILATQNYFYVVSQDVVLTASDKTDIPADSIESSQLGGPVVGAGLISWNTVVILVPRHGLLTIKPIPIGQETLGLDDTYSEIRVPDHLALSITQANLADLVTSEDNVNRYKSAFLMFLQKKPEESTKILVNLFPTNIPSMAPHDPLDMWTVAFCNKLIDEAPVSDPRWVASFGRSDEQDPLGMKSKILIKNFLMDKKEGLELFFGFINSMGIWARLQGLILKEDAVATGSLLYNSYEKVYFALSLQNMQNETPFRKSIDTAIKSIVLMRSEKERLIRSSHLSPNDLFYKDISRVHQVIPALVSMQEQDISQLSPQEIPFRIIQTNEIILRAILEVNSYSQQPGEKLPQIHDFLIKPLMTSETNQYEVLSWVVQRSVLPWLMKQQDIIVEQGIRNSEADMGQKLDLLKQLQQFTDVILDGMRMNVESIQGCGRYLQKLGRFEASRAKLLRTHLEVEDYDGACLLAEKYLDFEILATICYDKKDFVRMEAYFDKYEEMNFPEFTFEWYVKQKKTAELIDSFSKSKVGDKLRIFLQQYPQLAWHHCAITEDFEGAATILKGLAEEEETLVDDKRFMMCMAKLAALAGEDPMAEMRQEDSQFIQEIDYTLGLIEYQNRLPDDVLTVFGMDRETMRVLSTSEIIDMYTTDEVEFEAENYWKAFGLTEFTVNQDLQKEKRLLILSRLIKRDPWMEWETDHPMDVIEGSSLYLFLTLAIDRGLKLDVIYPLLELSTFVELEELMKSANAKFLLRACHEHLSTVLIPKMQVHQGPQHLGQGDVEMTPN